MAENDTVTVVEAAAMLGVPRDKITRLLKAGVLSCRPSVLDARRRLIPRAEVEKILEEEGHAPAKRRTEDEDQPPLPRTLGMYAGPVTVHSDEFEDYMAAHFRLE